MSYYDPVQNRVPYAFPVSHRDHSAYTRDTYTGGELQYRGKPTPTPPEPEPCEQPSS